MESAKILIVEDEPSIAEVITLYLRRAGFSVNTAKDGDAALRSLEQGLPDLVVLDIMLPHIDGITITRWIRDRSDTPIIMLTARREEIDRIAGLEMGADDYVVKPFSPQELVSRVRAVLRRTRGKSETKEESPIDIANLRIEPDTRVVTVNGEKCSLTLKEFELLLLLTRHPRQVFSRQKLLEQVWGLSEYIDPGTVTVHIRRLREKIEADPSHPEHIQTVWGIGYKFEP